MSLRVLAPILVAAAVSAPAPAQPARIAFAGGHWAALDRGGRCEAISRSLRIAAKGREQARAGFGFDSSGALNGQFFARLSRTPRAGSTVMLKIGNQPFLLLARGEWAWSRGPRQEAAIIAAARSAGGMRIDARDGAGRRFVDRYLLDGAATAIDSAAACALAKRQPRP